MNFVMSFIMKSFSGFSYKDKSYENLVLEFFELIVEKALTEVYNTNGYNMKM